MAQDTAVSSANSVVIKCDAASARPARLDSNTKALKDVGSPSPLVSFTAN
jgi:hypothetical protein